jgi:hypothetical protein
MSWWAWLIILLVVLVLFGLYLSQTAGRLDRLHRRVDAGRVSLDRALLERQTVASEVAGALLPDPFTAEVIADAVREARRTDAADDLARGLAESNLSRVLAATFDDAEAVSEVAAGPEGELMNDLESCTRRVQLSRRFYNDAVRACRDVRDNWLVGKFRLAGHTPLPEPFEMDDVPPPGFGVR